MKIEIQKYKINYQNKKLILNFKQLSLFKMKISYNYF